MSDEKVNVMKPARPLSDAIRDIKNAMADRTDVVVNLRDAHHIRLELLANELEPVFTDVPKDIDNFDFAISSGLQPRLWIDAVSHVSLGRDRRTFSFVRDTRIGRVMLAESTDAKHIADQVTRYIAERIVEREQMMESSAKPTLAGSGREAVLEDEVPLQRTARSAFPGFLSSFGLLVAGAVVGIAVMAALYWLHLAATGLIT